MKPSFRFLYIVLILFLFHGACLIACTAHYPLYPREGPVDRELQNRVAAKLHEALSDEVLVILCFSGGGTRAASMSYGVLEALQAIELPTRTTVQAQEKSVSKRTLLDQVKVITAVSGGSFTATYYGLHGKGIFKTFKEEFLLQDVQSGLLWQAVNPFNWPRVFGSRFSRSDFAQEYYDEIIFKGATLGDMIVKEGPLIILLATDAVEGISFSFEPNQFNLICTDYGHFPVSRAVAASSAFPGVFTPIVLKNYAGQCDYKAPDWVKKAMEKRDISSRAYWMASSLNLYTDAKAKPYIYLTDGGISDNLGVRRLRDIVAGQGGLRSAMAQSGLSGVKKVAFLIVDAQTPVSHGAMIGDIPDLRFVLGSTYTIMINRNNFDTVDLLRRYIHDWRQEDIAAGRTPLDVYTIHLSFDSLPEKLERDFFHNIPTTFSLPEEQVDRLRDVAGRLLYSNEEFRKLVADVGGNIPAKTGKPDKAPAKPAPVMKEEIH